MGGHFKSVKNNMPHKDKGGKTHTHTLENTHTLLKEHKRITIVI